MSSASRLWTVWLCRAMVGVHLCHFGCVVSSTPLSPRLCGTAQRQPSLGRSHWSQLCNNGRTTMEECPSVARGAAYQCSAAERAVRPLQCCPTSSHLTTSTATTRPPAKRSHNTSRRGEEEKAVGAGAALAVEVPAEACTDCLASTGTTGIAADTALTTTSTPVGGKEVERERSASRLVPREAAAAAEANQTPAPLSQPWSRSASSGAMQQPRRQQTQEQQQQQWKSKWRWRRPGQRSRRVR